MRNYEVTFIVDPVLSGDEIKKTAQAYNDMLVKEGCSITHVEDLGLRQLAYPINKKSSGIYYCIEFQSETGAFVSQIELAFRRDERIMRFLSVKLDKYGVKYNKDKRDGKIGKSRKTVERDKEKEKEELKSTSVPRKSAPAASAAPEKKAAPVTAPTPEPVKAESPAPEAVKAEAPAATPAPAAAVETPAAETDVKETVTVKASGDTVDLTKIEGIGPKAAEALVAAGIVSYTHLKLKSADDIKAILDKADGNFGMMDPTTWPEQASYAANGDWDALKKWQDELDGGKVVSSEEE